MFSYQKNLRGLGAESRSGRKFSAQVICSKSKKTTYAYDLVSGNVKAVHYQTGQADQFHHRYTYDADNRLVTTRTSTDGVLWVMDSKQLYYRHGPVARIELGEKQVQASDYVYTLHGWIKGMNSTVLAAGLDPGQDGHAANRPNGNFGRDVASFALEYYNGDYRAVAASVNTPAGNWQAAVWGAGPYSAALKGLYNGNIAGMQTNVLLPQSTTTSGLQGMAYRYDQLNRIKTTAAFRDGAMSAANNVWGAGAVNNGAYAETFSYDLNGNILTATRNGNLTGSQQVMDQFAYRYVRDAAGAVVTNKLGHVDDAVAVGNYADDIDDQATGNYVYDAVGNLVSDVREEIQTIDWNQQGKIKSIVRTTGSTKAELVFGYDANGQRAFKQVKPRTGGTLAQEQDWKTTWYVRDAQGNVLAVYEQSDSTTGANAFVRRLRVQERHVYGGKRLGLVSENTTVATVNLVNAGGYTSGNAFVGVSFAAPSVVAGPGAKVSRWLGRKRYELSNHLGNVLAVVSDRKRGVDGNADGVVDYYMAEVVSASDYYAFGSSMPGRSFISSVYRYGFNGKEKDDENSGSYDFGMRIHDPRLGRFLSIDPDYSVYASLSPYCYAGNSSIICVDMNGRGPVPVTATKIVMLTPEISNAKDAETMDLLLKQAKDLLNPPTPPKLPVPTNRNIPTGVINTTLGGALVIVQVINNINSTLTLGSLAQNWYNNYQERINDFRTLSNWQSSVFIESNVRTLLIRLCELNLVIVSSDGLVEIFTDDFSRLSEEYCRGIIQRIESGQARPTDWRYASYAYGLLKKAELICDDPSNLLEQREVVEFIQGTKENARKVFATVPEGYKRTKLISKGQPVFYNGKDYISPDNQGHKAGVWKRSMDPNTLGDPKKRMGTYDNKMVRIAD